MYSFKVYQDGRCILETEEMDLKKAHDYYLKFFGYYPSLRLFENGEKIPHGAVTRTLKITRAEMFSFIEKTN